MQQAAGQRPAGVCGASTVMHVVARAPLLSTLHARRCRLPVARAEADKDAATPTSAPAGTGSSTNGATSNGAAGGSSRAASGEGTSTSGSGAAAATSSVAEEEGFSWSAFWSGPLPGKLAGLLGLIVMSRVGVYVRLPGARLRPTALVAVAPAPPAVHDRPLAAARLPRMTACTCDSKPPAATPCIAAPLALVETAGCAWTW